MPHPPLSLRSLCEASRAATQIDDITSIRWRDRQHGIVNHGAVHLRYARDKQKRSKEMPEDDHHRRAAILREVEHHLNEHLTALVQLRIMASEQQLLPAYHRTMHEATLQALSNY